jgi:regulatory protein YycI of two-component signal transduction system YycFG
LAQLAEAWGLTVYGRPITYKKFLEIKKAKNETLMTFVDAVEKHISDNYLKVNYTIRNNMFGWI